jgi:Tfp pilus assembly protein PilF
VRKLSQFAVAALCGAIGLTGCANSMTGSSTATRSGEKSTLSKLGSAMAATPTAVANVFRPERKPSWSKSEAPPASESTSIFASKPEASVELRIATARVYEKNGNYKEAAEQYDRALAKSPNDVAVLLSYGHLLDHQGKLPEATQMYERAVKANPKEAAAHNDLGLCYARRGQINESLKSLGKAVELQPEKSLYRNNLATVLVQQRRTDEALVQLKAGQDESIAHYNLAYLLMQHQQEGLAATHFRRAAELNPSMAEARDWSERLAGRQPQSAPVAQVAQVQRAAPPAQQYAATPAPRPGSYGPAPEPTNSRYMRPDMTLQPNSAAVGSRYAAQMQQGAPPTPESLSNYQPQINGAELHFLPPVE